MSAGVAPDLEGCATLGDAPSQIEAAALELVAIDEGCGDRGRRHEPHEGEDDREEAPELAEFERALGFALIDPIGSASALPA